MSRITEAFQKKGKAFIPFVTGGDPDIETTKRLIREMAARGADLIEIGIPFSDPIAEGPVIQAADERALGGGVTTDDLFAMVRELRKDLDIPLVFMTYYNPVFSYNVGAYSGQGQPQAAGEAGAADGREAFLNRCEEVGIDGVIIPDLPFEESEEVRGICHAHHIDLINMIAPTSEERIRRIAETAEGFLYCVSSLGVTGMREQITTDVASMIEKVRAVSAIPCAIGFGISTPAQAREMAAVSDGVIVGSAIVRMVAQQGADSVAAVGDYVAEMKRAANS